MSNAESRDALTDMAAYWIGLAERAEIEQQQQIQPEARGIG
jgi:hypothetical protein